VKQAGTKASKRARADLDVEIGGRRWIVRAAPDRKASQSAHSASFSPFPTSYPSAAVSSSSPVSLLEGLRVRRTSRGFPLAKTKHCKNCNVQQ